VPHRHGVLAPKDSFQVLGKPGVFCRHIHSLKIDQRVQGIDAAEPLCGVAAMCDELGDFVVDGVVE
jgi:hypothetical protein